MKVLYLKIVEAFENNKQRFVDAGLQPFEVIDLYGGQPDSPASFEFTCPALFIDYGIDWERGSALMKKGMISVETHILLQPHVGTENINPRMIEGLAKLEYYDLVSELIETVSTENISTLRLISEKPAMTEYFCYHTMTFDAAIYRQKQSKLTSIHSAKPNITIQ